MQTKIALPGIPLLCAASAIALLGKPDWYTAALWVVWACAASVWVSRVIQWHRAGKGDDTRA